MRLYDELRVIEVEATPSFIAAQTKLAARSQAMKTARTTRINVARATLRDLPLSVPSLPHDALEEAAFHAWQEAGGRDYMGRDTTNDPVFTERITVAHLADDLAEYHREQVDEVARTLGDEAHAMMTTRVREEITRVYPRYRNACEWHTSYEDHARKQRASEDEMLLPPHHRTRS